MQASCSGTQDTNGSVR